jgi:hypothetical protein
LNPWFEANTAALSIILVLLIGGNEGNIFTRNPTTNQIGPVCGDTFTVKEVR